MWSNPDTSPSCCGSTAPRSAPGCRWRGSAWCWAAWSECPGGRSSPPASPPRPHDASTLPRVPSWSTQPWWNTGAARLAPGRPRTSAGCRGRTGRRVWPSPAKRSAQTGSAAGKTSLRGTWIGTSRRPVRQRPGARRALGSWLETWGWSSDWGLRLNKPERGEMCQYLCHFSLKYNK